MADFVDYVRRSQALQEWFANASPETLRRIKDNMKKHNPLFARLVKEVKIAEKAEGK